MEHKSSQGSFFLGRGNRPIGSFHPEDQAAVSQDATAPGEPPWREPGRRLAESGRGGGIQVLERALELAVRQLSSEECDHEIDDPRLPLIIRAFAARAIATTDGIAVLLRAGCGDQANPLVRSLHELSTDLSVLIDDPAARDVFGGYATVEQATLAMALPPERSRDAAALLARREYLASVLLERLRQSHPDAATKCGARPNLEEVVREYSKARLGQRFPSGWRKEYQVLHGKTREDLIRTAALVAYRVMFRTDTVVPEVWDQFLAQIELEDATIPRHLSADVHNSPLSLSRHVDPTTLAVTAHGPIRGAIPALGGALVMLTRIMLAHSHYLCSTEFQPDWDSINTEMDSWTNGADS